MATGKSFVRIRLTIVFKATEGSPWASSQSIGETVERRFALCGVGLDTFSCAMIDLRGFQVPVTPGTRSASGVSHYLAATIKNPSARRLKFFYFLSHHPTGEMPFPRYLPPTEPGLVSC